jgi:hypothetical protein
LAALPCSPPLQVCSALALCWDAFGLVSHLLIAEHALIYCLLHTCTGFGELSRGVTYPGQRTLVAFPLVAVIPFPPPSQHSNASAGLGTGKSAPTVVDVGLLLNPPKTSVDLWVSGRRLLLTSDAVWPSPEQLAAQVAAAGRSLNVSSNGLKVSAGPGCGTPVLNDCTPPCAGARML